MPVVRAAFQAIFFQVGVCSRYNARSDWLIVTTPRADYGLAKTKQKVIKKPYNKLLSNSIQLIYRQLKHFIKAKVERKNLRKITVKYVFQAKFGHFSVDYEFSDAKLKFSAIYLLSWT